MLKFKRRMINGKGKVFRPGQRVPDNFSTAAGLAEMIKAGDIEDTGTKLVEVPADFEPPAQETEPVEETPEPEAQAEPEKPKRTRKPKG
jgi:hypothetical protein